MRVEVANASEAGRFLRTLLPVHDPAGDVHGITGLRIRQRTETGIELYRLGQTTSLWLTGVPPRVWRHAEQDQLASITERGWQPCWRDRTTWTRAEILFHHEYFTDAWAQRFERGAWCTSGLLRRMALFSELSTAESTTAWLTHPSGRLSDALIWCIELDHATDAARDTNPILDALTDPDFGLPLHAVPFGDEVLDASPHQKQVADEEASAAIELRFTDFTTFRRRAAALRTDD
ncbi:hypothetical protein [Streptomyces sp. NPDC055400]